MKLILLRYLEPSLKFGTFTVCVPTVGTTSCLLNYCHATCSGSVNSISFLEALSNNANNIYYIFWWQKLQIFPQTSKYVFSSSIIRTGTGMTFTFPGKILRVDRQHYQGWGNYLYACKYESGPLRTHENLSFCIEDKRKGGNVERWRIKEKKERTEELKIKKWYKRKRV